MSGGLRRRRITVSSAQVTLGVQGGEGAGMRALHVSCSKALEKLREVSHGVRINSCTSILTVAERGKVGGYVFACLKMDWVSVSKISQETLDRF